MTYEELIEETGAMIGIEGFTPDADGVCVIASDIGEIVVMDCKDDPRGLVLLNAAVADVPPDANAALLVNVNSEDFPGAPEEDPLAGMRFQDDLEQAAFRLGGGNGFAPVQRSEDFLAGRPSERIGRVKPTYLPGYTLTDLGTILPGFVAETLREAIPYFDRKIKGYGDPDAILTGVETRSSSPVTILRGEDLMSSIPGLYPCGEGPGYAGGITSAAVDGIKVARQIIETEKGDQR